MSSNICNIYGEKSQILSSSFLKPITALYSHLLCIGTPGLLVPLMVTTQFPQISLSSFPLICYLLSLDSHHSPLSEMGVQVYMMVTWFLSLYAWFTLLVALSSYSIYVFANKHDSIPLND